MPSDSDTVLTLGVTQEQWDAFAALPPDNPRVMLSVGYDLKKLTMSQIILMTDEEASQELLRQKQAREALAAEIESRPDSDPLKQLLARHVMS